MKKARPLITASMATLAFLANTSSAFCMHKAQLELFVPAGATASKKMALAFQEEPQQAKPTKPVKKSKLFARFGFNKKDTRILMQDYEDVLVASQFALRSRDAKFEEISGTVVSYLLTPGLQNVVAPKTYLGRCIDEAKALSYFIVSAMNNRYANARLITGALEAEIKQDRQAIAEIFKADFAKFAPSFQKFAVEEMSVPSAQVVEIQQVDEKVSHRHVRANSFYSHDEALTDPEKRQLQRAVSEFPNSFWETVVWAQVDPEAPTTAQQLAETMLGFLNRELAMDVHYIRFIPLPGWFFPTAEVSQKVKSIISLAVHNPEKLSHEESSLLRRSLDQIHGLGSAPSFAKRDFMPQDIKALQDGYGKFKGIVWHSLDQQKNQRNAKRALFHHLELIFFPPKDRFIIQGFPTWMGPAHEAALSYRQILNAAVNSPDRAIKRMLRIGKSIVQYETPILYKIVEKNFLEGGSCGRK